MSVRALAVYWTSPCGHDPRNAVGSVLLKCSTQQCSFKSRTQTYFRLGPGSVAPGSINDRAEACSRWFRSPESPDHEGSGKRTRIYVLREESDTVANVQCPELMRSRQDAFACSASCWSFLTGGSRKMASATADLAAGSCFDRRHFRA